MLNLKSLHVMQIYPNLWISYLLRYVPFDYDKKKFVVKHIWFQSITNVVYVEITIDNDNLYHDHRYMSVYQSKFY